MARVVEGVITGIGFIGGGAILKGSGEVQGTATAASLGATGAIGVAVGLANYDVALVICLFTVLTLDVLGRLKPKDTRRHPATVEARWRRASACVRIFLEEEAIGRPTSHIRWGITSATDQTTITRVPPPTSGCASLPNRAKVPGV